MLFFTGAARCRRKIRCYFMFWQQNETRYVNSLKLWSCDCFSCHTLARMNNSCISFRFPSWLVCWKNIDVAQLWQWSRTNCQFWSYTLMCYLLFMWPFHQDCTKKNRHCVDDDRGVNRGILSFWMQLCCQSEQTAEERWEVHDKHQKVEQEREEQMRSPTVWLSASEAQKLMTVTTFNRQYLLFDLFKTSETFYKNVE